jgi:O-antigen ligase
MAAVAGLSVFMPDEIVRIGPLVAIVVFISGAPGKLRFNLGVLASFGFIIWSLASLGWAADSDGAVSATFIWASALLMFIVLADLIRSTLQLRVVATGYLLGCFGAVVFAFITKLSSADSGSLLNDRIGVGNLNVNYLAYAISAGFATIVLLWLTQKRTLRVRLSLSLAAVALVIGVLLTDTRGALLSLFLVIFWLGICATFRKPSIRLLFAVLSLAVLSTITGIIDKMSLVFETGSRATGDWSGRLLVWPVARDLWAENPFLGVGAGGFSSINPYQIRAHNTVLEIGSNLGIVGVLLFVTIIWSSLVASTRMMGNRVRAILLGSFIAAAAPAYLSGAWETAPAAWIAIAIFSRIAVLEAGENSLRDQIQPSRRMATS